MMMMMMMMMMTTFEMDNMEMGKWNDVIA